MILLAYVVTGVLAVLRRKGSGLALLTLPLAISALKDCKPEVTSSVLGTICLRRHTRIY